MITKLSQRAVRIGSAPTTGWYGQVRRITSKVTMNVETASLSSLSMTIWALWLVVLMSPSLTKAQNRVGL
jgi:hypothetical protein